MNTIIKTIFTVLVSIPHLYAASEKSEEKEWLTAAFSEILSNEYGDTTDVKENEYEDTTDVKKNEDKLEELGKLKYKDTFILRLGSSPQTKEWLHNPNDADNSYNEWRTGLYGQVLRQLGIPMRNIIHCYCFEGLGDYVISNESFHYVAKDGNVTRLVTDFNRKDLASVAKPLMNELKNSPNSEEIKFFDYIITDNRVTKFIKSEKTLYNILETLKVGGKAIFTDLNENETYAREIDYNGNFHAFVPKKKADFKTKYEIKKESNSINVDTSSNENDKSDYVKPEWEKDGRLGLLDLLFKDYDGKTISFNGLKLKVKFYNHMTDMSFLNEDGDVEECFKLKDVSYVAKYLLALGNTSFYNKGKLVHPWSKTFHDAHESRLEELSKNRCVVIERVN